jgi:hypothetical protein
MRTQHSVRVSAGKRLDSNQANQDLEVAKSAACTAAHDVRTADSIRRVLFSPGECQAFRFLAACRAFSNIISASAVTHSMLLSPVAQQVPTFFGLRKMEIKAEKRLRNCERLNRLPRER